MNELPVVYVVFPVFNRLKETIQFLECMSKQDYARVKTVICDDGSTDGTGDFLREQGNVVTVQGTGDLWWAGGINRCVEYVLKEAGENDLVLTINNDVTIGVDYISQKVYRSIELQDSIIGSICVYQSDHNVIETSGEVMNYATCRSKSLVKHGTKRSEISLHGCVPATHVPGKGVLIPVKVFRELGLYDSRGLPHYHADSDFTLRAHEHGIPVYVDFDSIVYSDVNIGNMNQASKITLKGIIRTFDSKRGVNSFPAYLGFARNHFKGRVFRYLFVNYTMIILGLCRRYLYSRFQRGRSV